MHPVLDDEVRPSQLQAATQSQQLCVLIAETIFHVYQLFLPFDDGKRVTVG